MYIKSNKEYTAEPVDKTFGTKPVRIWYKYRNAHDTAASVQKP